MSDVECPYCGAGQNINHDDGYGYEDGPHEQQCCACKKMFAYETEISFSYKVMKADCLNGGDHSFSPVKRMVGEGFEDWQQCVACGHEEAAGERIEQ